MYRLIKEKRGSKIALANPSVLISDEFLGTGDNQAFINANLSKLAHLIERKDGKALGVEPQVEAVEDAPKVKKTRKAKKPQAEE